VVLNGVSSIQRNPRLISRNPDSLSWAGFGAAPHLTTLAARAVEG
jgi:hypothetical protein